MADKPYTYFMESCVPYNEVRWRASCRGVTTQGDCATWDEAMVAVYRFLRAQMPDVPDYPEVFNRLPPSNSTI